MGALQLREFTLCWGIWSASIRSKGLLQVKEPSSGQRECFLMGMADASDRWHAEP